MSCNGALLVANADVVLSDDDEAMCHIAAPDTERREYRPAPFEYRGMCAAWLREAHEPCGDADHSGVDPVLDETGCEQLPI